MANKSDSPASYPDVKLILDLALERPGLRYEFNAPGRATHFITRCNKYRKMLRDIAAETAGSVPGYRASSAYDILVIKQVNGEGLSDKKSGRIVQFDHIEVEGRLIDPDTGEEIKLNVPGITDSFKEPEE